MRMITLEKEFRGEGSYPQESIDVFNDCIDQGIDSIKQSVIRCDGTYTMTETKDQLIISADRDEFVSCFEDESDGIAYFDSLFSNILGIADNYAIQFSEDETEVIC